jgi:osmoprotectant transport system permease protein
MEHRVLMRGYAKSTAFWRAALVALAWLATPMTHAGSEHRLTIGSKRFTEAYIVAEVLAQTARPHAAVQVRAGLGNTAIVYEALRAGQIDVYPEYTGTIDLEILKNPKPTSIAAMNAQLAPLGLGVAVPLGFHNGYALAMRAQDAQQRGIRTLSSLAQHPTLRLGLSNEFIGRADGWPGLKQRYGLPQQPAALDHGLAYQAIADAQTDVIDIYTTDAKIDHLGLVVLQDDRGYFPRYDAVLLYRLDVPQRFPAAWAALQKLQASIDEKAMIGMNARAELHSVPFEQIARDHLNKANSAAKPASGVPPLHQSASQNDKAGRGFVSKLFGPDLGRLTRQHLLLVLVSVATAVAIGVPLAIAVAARPVWRAAVLGVAGVLQTIPSLAMLAALIAVLGTIGTGPALVALTLYALLPIVRNTCTGLAEVPAGLKAAAVAVGLSRQDQLLSIELPLAWPTIVAGIRTATAICVGTATLAAFIGAGGYGERIVTGLALNDRELLMAGAVPAALLALGCEAVFEAIERAMRRRREG